MAQKLESENNGEKEWKDDGKQHRSWCLTDYKIENWGWYREDVLAEKTLSFAILGLETCPSTGRKHIQGYLETKTKRKWGGLLKLLPEGVHLESTIVKDWKYAKNYAKKEGNWEEFGVCMAPGARVDLIAIKKMVEEKGMAAVIESGASYQQICYAEKVQKHEPAPIRMMPKVIWIWGPGRSGKSTMAKELLKEIPWENQFWAQRAWFDGMQGAKATRAIVLDDFRDSWFKLTDFLKMTWTDPCKMEIKGTSSWINPEIIIITTPKHPKEYYTFSLGEDTEQLKGRIDKVIETKVIPGMQRGKAAEGW